MATLTSTGRFAAGEACANNDVLYGPYATIEAAHEALLNAEQNVIGRTIGVQTGNTIEEYWYQGGIEQTNLIKKVRSHPYISLERLREYLYRVTFNSIPEDDGGRAPVVGGCSAFVKDGKLFRNFDFKYDNAASFIVRTKDFEGMAMITGLDDATMDDEMIAQLPYHMVDGRNNDGIMVSVHLLFNDWEYTGVGDKSIPMMRLPYEVLTRVKSMDTIATDLADVLGNLEVTASMGVYLLQCLVTDGTTTYAIVPPTSDNQSYTLVEATSYPKMTNFLYVARAEVSRQDMDMQNRPTGIERFNIMPCELSELRFTKCYENTDRLSEFIGIDGTTKASTDEELTAIYEEARSEYLVRQRDGVTWQTMHSVVYDSHGIKYLYVQENWKDNCVTRTVFESGEGDGSVVQKIPESSQIEAPCAAKGVGAIATGIDTNANSNYSHAEGMSSMTLDSDLHPGWDDGVAAHAEGNRTTATGRASHAEGDNTVTNNVGEHAEGRYNMSHFATDEWGNAGNTVHSVGIGDESPDTHLKNRKNAIEIMQNGDTYMIGVGGYDGTNPDESKTIQETLEGKIDYPESAGTEGQVLTLDENGNPIWEDPKGGTSFEDLGYQPFSTTEPYSAGDVVIYNGKLYEFTESHPAGAWTGDDVNPTSVAAQGKLLRDLIDEGYQFRGVATPATNPGTPDQKVFYITGASGTYANFGIGNLSEVSIIKNTDTGWEYIGIGIPFNLANINSNGGLEIYPGISTSSSTKYSLSKVVPANKETTIRFTIENNAYPSDQRMAVYFKDENGTALKTHSLLNGDIITETFASDVYSVSFGISDAKITATGNVTVEFEQDGIIKVIEDRLEDVEDLTQEHGGEINNLEDGLEDVKQLIIDFESSGGLLIYPGISTSSSTKYSLSKVVPANKETTIRFTIENNAIPQGTVYFKDSLGNSVGNYGFVNGSKIVRTFDSDIHFVSFSLTDRNIVDTGNIIVSFHITSTINERFEDIENNALILSGRVDNIESSLSTLSAVSDGGTLSKELINADRPYYFNQGWNDDDNFGYLDNIISSLPNGKHFLLFADIHLDYSNNIGLRQKQSMIMKYVSDRLQGCKVVFLGDFIGSVPTEIKAQKEMNWFSNEYYTLFGKNFVPVLGDHDTDRVNGGLPDGEELTTQFVFDTYFKPAYRYGAVGDSAISVVDDLTFSDDPVVNASKKQSWKNYLSMHYYVDDVNNKLRFIVVQNATIFRDIPNTTGISSVNLPFVANALATAPNGYSCIIVSHEFGLGITENTINTYLWQGKLAQMVKAFKSQSTYVPQNPTISGDELTMVYNALVAEYPSSFDYSTKNGNILLIQGDEHIDYAGYIVNAERNTAFPEDITNNDFLQLFIDRACIVQNLGFHETQFPDKEYIVGTTRRAKGGNLIGTTDEVIFDIATIANNSITLTRVGSTPVAGRVGDVEVFNSTESYSVGDEVLWWEMLPESTSYQVYKYKFINAHSGEWDIDDVERVEETQDIYQRQYII